MIKWIKPHVSFNVLYTNLQTQADLAIFLQNFLWIKTMGNKLTQFYDIIK